MIHLFVTLAQFAMILLRAVVMALAVVLLFAGAVAVALLILPMILRRRRAPVARGA
ncbi:hypothetical protein [Sphingomonas parapaucimobilis]|uniref:hypothetical protein n=1 Tax=Sphingomonas parapaucimobilis TaxID=28213 RepID=UPI0035C7E487